MNAATTWSLKTAKSSDEDVSLVPYLFYAVLLALWIVLLSVLYGVISDAVARGEAHRREAVNRTLALARCDWQVGDHARQACRARVSAASQQAELPSLTSDAEPSLNLAYR